MFLDTFQVLKAIGFTYKYCYDTFRSEYPDLHDKLMHASLPLELNFIRHCRSVLKENNFDLNEFNSAQTSRRKTELTEQKKHVPTPPCSPTPSITSTLVESQPRPEVAIIASLKSQLHQALVDNDTLKDENLKLKLQIAKHAEEKKEYSVAIINIDTKYRQQLKTNIEINKRLIEYSTSQAKELKDIINYNNPLSDTNKRKRS